jgi:hypothetical protein
MNDQEKSPVIERYKLADAMSLFSSQTAAMYQLWAFYTATVLGSIVFGLSRTHTCMTASVFLVGYWAFSLGELALLFQTMRLLRAIREYISTFQMESHDEGAKRLNGVLSCIAKTKNPFCISMGIQLLGSICVTLLVAASAAGWVPPAK